MDHEQKKEQLSWPEWYCPVHQRSLNDIGGALTCPEGCTFSSRKGILQFVQKSNYSDAFGVQWKTYRRTQLDSYSGTTITRDRLIRCMGEELLATLSGKSVLECGCGAGRFTEILLGKGAQLTSIDLSEAVEANQENFPQDSHHRIAQADILHFPFKPQQYDFVVCLGVIQHTPSPEATIDALYNQLKPGGWLIIDHYTHTLSWYTKTAPLFRRFLRRLPPDEGMKRTEWLVDTLLPYHAMLRDFRPGQMLLSRLSPVLCYFHRYPELSDELHREWALLDTHDSLTDWYKHFRTRGQIQNALEKLGLEEIWCRYGGNGVEARGKRL
jgi:2-polyprenyl-3-methyl-5-hydroxy-6-metoxy-1,4-benzoquinol methylase